MLSLACGLPLCLFVVSSSSRGSGVVASCLDRGGNLVLAGNLSSDILSSTDSVFNWRPRDLVRDTGTTSLAAGSG